jgi:hypothetical protein
VYIIFAAGLSCRSHSDSHQTQSLPFFSLPRIFSALLSTQIPNFDV